MSEEDVIMSKSEVIQPKNPQSMVQSEQMLETIKEEKNVKIKV